MVGFYDVYVSRMPSRETSADCFVRDIVSDVVRTGRHSFRAGSAK
jgi:hypothetical protein